MQRHLYLHSATNVAGAKFRISVLRCFPKTSLTPLVFASDTPKGCRHPRLGTPVLMRLTVPVRKLSVTKWRHNRNNMSDGVGLGDIVAVSTVC